MLNKTSLIAAMAVTAMVSTATYAQRGRDGHLNILYWQASSTVNPYLSGGTKDIEAASLVIEPLAHYDEDGNMVPVLVDEIPTVENGGVASDLRSITWKLTPGIKWSDGTPLTAHDVVFSGEYCVHEEAGCNSTSYFTDVTKFEALDDHTVKIHFGVAKPFPYGPFVGSTTPIIQKAQFQDCMGAKAQECTEQNFGPIGTGPFKVEEFRANDVITFSANEHYRDSNKPAFATATFKGGGDAASAARTVLETGEFDYAWNLQVEPEVLAQMAAAGKGTVVTAFGTSVERLMVNQTNDDPSLGPEKRSLYLDGTNPHPFLSDPAVRRALSLAIDRQILVDAGYGAAGQVTCNVLPAPAVYASTANDECKTPNVDEANRILDEAGWAHGSDGVRAKDGVRLSILYQTSTNSVRQGTQALI
ncbi:MAG: peptide ABC transporter substrate-binding protein, partial [Bryobacterales bacterium]|nr:peptide ABC transporter substrate-binding protein [Bryobacterales bacterium]